MAADKYIELSTAGRLTEKSPAVAGGSGNENKIVALDAAGKIDDSMLSSEVKVWRAYGCLAGQPTAGQELFVVEMLGDEVFASGLPSNRGGCQIAPTGSVTLVIKVNGVSIGSMNIAAAATDATWTMVSTYTATAGDLLEFYAPASVDGTLSGLHYTFIGVRT